MTRDNRQAVTDAAAADDDDDELDTSRRIRGDTTSLASSKQSALN